MNLEEKRGETGGTQAKVTFQDGGLASAQDRESWDRQRVVLDTCSEAGHVTWSDPWWISAELTPV